MKPSSKPAAGKPLTPKDVIEGRTPPLAKTPVDPPRTPAKGDDDLMSQPPPYSVLDTTKKP